MIDLTPDELKVLKAVLDQISFKIDSAENILPIHKKLTAAIAALPPEPEVAFVDHAPEPVAPSGPGSEPVAAQLQQGEPGATK